MRCVSDRAFFLLSSKCFAFTFQAYEAEFRIRHSLACPPLNLYSHINDTSIRQAVIIADIALNVYISDTKIMVTSGINEDLKVDRYAEDIDNVSPKERLRFLKKWNKAENPFSYEGGTFQHLVRAISTTREDIALGLPHMENQKISLHEFAQMLFSMAKPINPAPIKAPILRKSGFLPVLQVAIKFIQRLWSNNSGSDGFAVHVLRIAADANSIRFIPWHLPPTQAPGRPSTNPTWKSWMQLGKADLQDKRFSTSNPFEQSTQDALSALKKAKADDTNVEWSSTDLALAELKLAFSRSKLPEDWYTPSDTLSPCILETYAWFKSIYDCQKPLHQLAIMIGIIVSRCLPNIFAPKEIAKKLAQANDRHTTATIARNSPWIPKQGRRGMAEKGTFVAMVATYLVAIYDKTSPLRQYAENNNNSFGPWSTKHSKYEIIIIMK